MTRKERILTAMRGQRPDRVPLTSYDWMLPRGTTERLLREAGVTEDAPVSALEASLGVIARGLEEHGAGP